MEERLQKYMAQCGVASRRKCEELILDGKVKVNGIIVNELGTKINPEIDIVEFNNQIIKIEEKKLYIMLNKPEGYITSAKDEKGRKTVLDIVNVQERIYPIGRLDYDSSGLLLLTNDGSIYNNIIHPRVAIKKKYN
jgi:23S rRNA pseudouridine2605 synthase